MKNMVRNIVLMAAILSPSFAMPSGEEICSRPSLDSYAFKSTIVSLFCLCSGAFGGAILDDGASIISIFL